MTPRLCATPGCSTRLHGPAATCSQCRRQAEREAIRAELTERPIPVDPRGTADRLPEEEPLWRRKVAAIRDAAARDLAALAEACGRRWGR